MFIGVDHGTQAVRFATLDNRKLELPRERIAESSVINDIEEGLNLKLEFVNLIGLTYSMGDGITRITNIKKVRNRGLKAQGGAGSYFGGGTAVYDAIYSSNAPAIVLPGIHDQSNICLLYTSDAADEEDSVDLGGRRIIKKKNKPDKKSV